MLFRRPLKPELVPDFGCEPDLEAVSSPPAKFQRRPPGAVAFERILNFFDRIFDQAYGSRANPLYKSGTLAVGLMAAAIVSGVFLLFYFRLGGPFESMERMQSIAWVRWVRAFHRYASDLTVIAVVFHLLRMGIEGKTWGPRTLAWISGVVLAGMMAVIAWTGFVMIWDQQALNLVRVGARLLDTLPLFPEPIGRAFGGALVPPASFFFMNLFLHVALPLGLIVGLWLHTSRLARSAWLPPQRLLAWCLVGVALLALAMPAALGSKADPLALGGAYPLNFWYAGFLPVVARWGSWFLPLSITVVVGVLASAPWWWRPSVWTQPPPSYNDEARCQGCVTCVHDCPFEAISMVPREAGQSGSALVARVDPSLCVSCGLCVGSCDRLSIGPTGRDGKVQMGSMQNFAREQAGDQVVLIHCGNNGAGKLLAAQAGRLGVRVLPYAVDCLGSVHPFGVHALQTHFKGVFLLGCPPALCQTREGYRLAEKRLIYGQEPAYKTDLDADRLQLVSGSTADVNALLGEFLLFCKKIGVPAPPPSTSVGSQIWRLARGAALSLPLLWVLGLLSAVPAGKPSTEGGLRLSFRVPGQVVKTCHDLTEEELKQRQAHMRRKTECTTRKLSYVLTVSIDDHQLVQETISPKGVHHDSPLNVEHQLTVVPGSHRIEASFMPLNADQAPVLRLKYAGTASVGEGRAVLLTLGQSGRELELMERSR